MYFATISTVFFFKVIPFNIKQLHVPTSEMFDGAWKGTFMQKWIEKTQVNLRIRAV